MTPRDYYAEEVEGKIPSRDYFSEEVLKKPRHPENVLQSAAKAFQQTVMPQQPNSFLSAIGSTMQSVTNSISPFYNFMHNYKSNLISSEIPDNPFVSVPLDIATDPETWLGGGLLGKGGARNIKNLFAPEKLSKRVDAVVEQVGGKIKGEYARGKSIAEGYNQGNRLSLGEELSDPSLLTGKPPSQADMKLMQHVKNEAAFQGMDVNNLSLDESKRVMDIVKGKSGLLKGSKDVGPTEINELGILNGLKRKQLEKFPELGPVNAAYGPDIENYNALSGKGRQIVGGTKNILQRDRMAQLKELSPEAYSEVKGYRGANAFWKGIKRYGPWIGLEEVIRRAIGQHGNYSGNY